MLDKRNQVRPTGYHLVGAFAILSLGAGAMEGTRPSEPVGLAPRAASLAPVREERILAAIDNGVEYLRRIQLKSGSWIDGKLVLDPKAKGTADPRLWPVGFAALPGLTLLECGIPAKAPEVQLAAGFVRMQCPGLLRTYEISLAILFLDRLRDPKDGPTIRSLALRLAAGQTNLGGWGYSCPILTPAQEGKFAEVLSVRKTDEIPKVFPPLDDKMKGAKAPRDGADNSNTQFALMALWVARKHDVPLDFTLGLAEYRFRVSQGPMGWAYVFRRGGSYGSMTCAGLLGLAVGRGVAAELIAESKKELPRFKDEGISFALSCLAGHMNDPSDSKGVGTAGTLGPKGALNLYFLWSVERMAVLYKLDTIGGKDWYRWGVDLLLPTQRRDGSWLGTGSAGSPTIDTCFALLFLKRSDLLPDLRETLQKRLTITDPGASPFEKSPGEKTDPKSEDKKKSPGEKSEKKGLGEALLRTTCFPHAL